MTLAKISLYCILKESNDPYNLQQYFYKAEKLFCKFDKTSYFSTPSTPSFLVFP